MLSFEDGDELRTAVRALPPRQRTVLVLRFWWGLSLEETARDLGCSVGTVKSQATRAVGRLRATLTGDARDGVR
jgi:RNA polymerase sigma factor (sigma-70 family)